MGLRRIYDRQEYNSSSSFHNRVLNTVLPQPSSSYRYSSSPRKKRLTNLWDKWASKSAMEESNSQSEETEQLSDTSYKSSPHSPFLLESPSKKRKRLTDEDKSLMASNKFSKIIYSYKKGGFVCRPTPQMLRKISEMRKKEQENREQLEKQRKEEEEKRKKLSK